MLNSGYYMVFCNIRVCVILADQLLIICMVLYRFMTATQNTRTMLMTAYKRAPSENCQAFVTMLLTAPTATYSL